jgi:hypothetical protein
MSSWRKRLAMMVADPRPNSYTYDEAATILANLGFKLAGKPKGSHRRWRLALPDPSVEGGKRTIIVGLVDRGTGPLKPVYIKEMIRTLSANNLLPPEEL